jgi:F-type H+-transporting ATPase subunit b
MPLFALLLQEGGEGGGQGPFTIEGGLILWTLVIFLILAFLLWKFGWPVILKSVEEREARIAKQLADAEKANAAAARLLEETKQALVAAKTEAQDIVTKAKTVALKEREHLVAKTREEQDALLERAKREIAAEREKAIQALRREAVELSIAAASKLVESNLDSEANRKLVLEYLASLEQSH